MLKITSTNSNVSNSISLESLLTSRNLYNENIINFHDYKNRYYTKTEDAINIIKERRKDKELMSALNEFLNNDIPKHFINKDPILYLSRHIATPNFEALKFIEIAKTFKLPIVIGQDIQSKFAAQNSTKKCLAKMQVVSGMTRYQDEIIVNFTIADFNSINGKKFTDIKTSFGFDISKFHNYLLKEIYSSEVTIADEHDWVNRNHRDNLVKQYEKMLALFICHGIQFESFPDEESDFFNKIFAEAYHTIFNKFGVRPLVVELISDEQEIERDWNHYPSIIYPYLKKYI